MSLENSIRKLETQVLKKRDFRMLEPREMSDWELLQIVVESLPVGTLGQIEIDPRDIAFIRGEMYDRVSSAAIDDILAVAQARGESGEISPEIGSGRHG